MVQHSLEQRSRQGHLSQLELQPPGVAHQPCPERTADPEQCNWEVAALNRMFQRQISQDSEAVEEFRRALKELQRVLGELAT